MHAARAAKTRGQAPGLRRRAGRKSNGWLSLLTYVLPFLIFIGFWIFLMNQVQGGGSKVMSFGKSRAKRMCVDSPKITFRDVAGADEAVEELHEIKEFLENPKKFQALGARIPKGVLLYGPPGTGKTLLARAVAGEAGVPFFSISGSDFVEMFVGVGASRVRDLFEQAKQNSPCIIFMDEIDAVGRHRGAGLGGGHDEREQTLNQLLVEMDGFEMKDNIILIAATNRPDILDPALLRPGRFDRQIVVDRPDRKGRAKILEVHTRGKPLAKEIDVDALAGQTPGFTGADLANLVNEAALLAARNGKREITQVELEEGIMRVIAGPEKKTRVMGEKERLITAYHEMGHAIVGHYLEHADPVHKISVVGRGQALGYTISMPQEDKFLTTRAELQDTMAMTLGGRAAEEIVFGEITTGASNDLEKVTATAKQMVMRFGMSERLGPRVFGHDHGQPFLGREFSSEPDYSDEIAREIDDEIRRIVEAAHQRAKDILTEHREQLETISRDPRQARDDREGRVRGAARRQVRGGGLRPRRARRRRRRRPGAAPADRPREAPRPLPRPGLAGAEARGLDSPERPTWPRRRPADRPGASCNVPAVDLPGTRPFLVMGVVNVTPDSFSDGGEWFDARRRDRARAGARCARAPTSSTSAASRRGPGAQPVPRGRGAARAPCRSCAALARAGATVSIDTTKLARRRGRARRRRDVRQRRHRVPRRPRARRARRRRAACDCCLMHMRGEPRTMQDDPRYDDVVADVKALPGGARWRSRSPRASPRSASTSTPGIGFGKTRRAQPRAAAPPRRDRRARPSRRGRHLAQVVPRPAHRPRRTRTSACPGRSPRTSSRSSAGRGSSASTTSPAARDALTVAAATLRARWRLTTTTSTSSTTTTTTRPTSTTRARPDRGHHRDQRALALHAPRRHRRRARGRPAARARPARSRSASVDATVTDLVEDTVDYGEVCNVVALVAQQRSYKTLERLCSGDRRPPARPTSRPRRSG